MGLGLGVSAAALGTVALASRKVSRRAEERAQQRRQRVQPTAWVGRDGGGLGLTGRF